MWKDARKVSKEEFDDWIKNYPGTLTTTFHTIVFPEQVHYHDDARGKHYEDNTVASYSVNGYDLSTREELPPHNYRIRLEYPDESTQRSERPAPNPWNHLF